MKPKTSNEVRKAFLEFFEEHGHQVIDSSPLPNRDNPTLLFTNAGMNQFANVFIGTEKRAYSRAATSQKVMRVQGKHNDLENVGPSPRHHTFFEMLGNFSFGDYFKKEAIAYAWQFLTEVVGLDKNRLFVTIFLDDDEANELWLEHISQERILRFGEEDNFWSMGDVGPCGPCSEIFYYWGEIEAMTPAGVNVSDEYLELWNLVFMQYDRDENGVMTPLPKPSIDTGMSLERIMQVIQQHDNVYDTDLFSGTLDRIQELLDDTEEDRAEHWVGYRVIADHGRAATFLIGDGVLPGNTGEGYVLRMIIRRAARFGRKIGFTKPFLGEIAQSFISRMGDAYPDIVRNADHIVHTLQREEERFARTLDGALGRLHEVMGELHHQGSQEIPGDIAFDLYSTHGLPLEITRDVAGEHGYAVDEPGYEEARAIHAGRSGSDAFSVYETGENIYAQTMQVLVESGQLPAEGVDQDPYSDYRQESYILAIMRDGASIASAKAGDTVEIVTGATPFYVESGGEVSDTGRLTVEETGSSADILDVKKQKLIPGFIYHIASVQSGELNVGDRALLEVDDDRRHDIRRNHTATHILHEELRNHLGNHVTQQGSLVEPNRLRFDFSHGEAVGKEALAAIEMSINEAILENHPISAELMDRDDAIAAGAMALFGEKYGDIVRTIAIGDRSRPYSLELCGGLHVSETGEIGLFRFISEGAVAAGIRRVEAVTGSTAYAYTRERLDVLERLSTRLNAPFSELEARIEALQLENKQLQKELDTIQKEALLGDFDSLLGKVVDVGSAKLLTAQIEGADPDGLRELIDRFRDKMPNGVAVLATVNNDRPLFVAGVSEALVKQGVHAGNIVREVAKVVGGGGGGRPNLAQAGGRDATKVAEALGIVAGLVEQSLE